MKQFIKKQSKAIWGIGLLIIFQACYPGGSIPISDLDTTSIYYNTDDLATAPTSAAIVWDVAEILDKDPDNNIPYNGEVDDEILNTTLLKLIEIYGVDSLVIISETSVLKPTPANPNIPIFIPVNHSEPDVDAIYISNIMLRKQYVGVVHPGYPWWPGGGSWWGGWHPGYGGCYYCGYPPTVSYQRYDVGTVITDMFDIRQLTAQTTSLEDFDPSWVALNRGLLSKDNDFNGARIESGIKKAFELSPYLKP